MSEPRVELAGRMLEVRLPEPCRALSWAIVGGGLRDADSVAWLEVTGDDLLPPVDPADLLSRALAERGLRDSVGFLTSRRLDRYTTACEQQGDLAAWAVATLGLSNGLAAGDPASYLAPPAGTINIHCHVSAPLS
ncbi:MAG: adenosylcobinamide amidohydrolase, partial [Acidobacteriota bacterium]